MPHEAQHRTGFFAVDSLPAGVLWIYGIETMPGLRTLARRNFGVRMHRERIDPATRDETRWGAVQGELRGCFSFDGDRRALAEVLKWA